MGVNVSSAGSSVPMRFARKSSRPPDPALLVIPWPYLLPCLSALSMVSRAKMGPLEAILSFLLSISSTFRSRSLNPFRISSESSPHLSMADALSSVSDLNPCSMRGEPLPAAANSTLYCSHNLNSRWPGSRSTSGLFVLSVSLRFILGL